MNKEIKGEREKRLTELGSKIRAGQLMTTLFRAVASEKTEAVKIKVPGKEGQMENRLVSKAEAIVRDIIQKALPSNTDEGDLDFVDPKIRLEYRKLILDRVDGKAGAVGEENAKTGESIPSKVSRVNKEFLNDQAKNATTKTTKPTKTKSTVPKVSVRKQR